MTIAYHLKLETAIKLYELQNTSINARQSDRKSPDSLALSTRVVLYSNNESETACSPLINSWARTCFRLIGAHGRSSFIAADTPAATKEISTQMEEGNEAYIKVLLHHMINYTQT